MDSRLGPKRTYFPVGVCYLVGPCRPWCAGEGVVFFLTASLVLFVQLQVTAALGDPVDYIPVGASCEEGPGILGERVEGQAIEQHEQDLPG